MEEYKPNSNKYKEEIKNRKDHEKVQKIIKGTARTQKKSKIRNFTDNIISEDAKNVKSYVFGEVLIPAIKKAISDIVTDGIDIILYGESKRGSKRSVSDRVSYRSYYDDSRSIRQTRTLNTSGYSYDDIVLDTRGEAEEVLSRMDELIDAYGLVRVADLYDLVGITGNYTDNKYGWTNIRSAEISRTRDGYLIRMPRAMPID